MDNNQRNYFRIDDLVGLELIHIDSRSSKAAEHYFKSDKAVRLSREFEQIDRDIHQAHRALGQNDKEIGIILRLLNKKIDLLGSTLVNDALDAKPNAKLQVSLSEGGIAFLAEHAYQKSDKFALKLTLLLEGQVLFITAKVIDSTLQDDQKYRISLSFEQLKDADRQILARHILKAQSLSIRESLNHTD
jgi:hypothetical protein